MLNATAIGHLGNDAVLKDVNGKKVLNFSIAHTEKWKNGQGIQNEKTTWVECAYWGNIDNLAPYLKKGVQVFVTGTPEARGWNDKDNKPHGSLTLRIDRLELLSGNKNNQQNQNQQAQQMQQQQQPQEGTTFVSTSDGLPF